MRSCLSTSRRASCTSAPWIFEWYVDWVLGDGDSDDDCTATDDDDDPAAESKAAATWASLTAAKEGSWKCDVCDVRNDKDASKCAACETPNPAAPPKAPASGNAMSAPGSVGPGGFSFGEIVRALRVGNFYADAFDFLFQSLHLDQLVLLFLPTILQIFLFAFQRVNFFLHAFQFRFGRFLVCRRGPIFFSH